MPLLVTTNWADGPMGPGFFLLFSANTAIFYDGGGFFELIGQRPGDAERQERFGELVALVILMRHQYDDC